MNLPPFQIGRRLIHFSRHAEERYLQRGGTRETMMADFETARWDHKTPAWANLSQWHRARAEGSLMLDEDRGFVVNRFEESGDLVAVSFIVRAGSQASGHGANRASRAAVP